VRPSSSPMMVHRPASKTHVRLAGHLKIEEKRTTYVKVYKLNSKMKVPHVFVFLLGSAKIGQSAILASGKGPRVRLWSQCSQVAGDRPQFVHVQRIGCFDPITDAGIQCIWAFSLHQRSTPGWASTDASPITNTVRNKSTYASVLNIIIFVGGCLRQQLRHMCMLLLIEYVLGSVNRGRCTGEIPCEDGGSTSVSKRGQPRRMKSTRTKEN